MMASLAGPGRVIQGMTVSPDLVPALRQKLRQQQPAGRAFVDPLTPGRLPYLDNLMNLVVVQNIAGLKQAGIGFSEILRVTGPMGMICIEGTSDEVGKQLGEMNPARMEQAGSQDGWVRLRKLKPAGMDEWPQTYHDPGNTMHSNDTLVGPPTVPQWISGPSLGEESQVKCAFHAAGGRVFFTHSIVDISKVFGELLGTYITAQDAWNGLELWHTPGSAPVAASSDRLYACAGEKPGKLSAIDAATGKVIRTYDFEPVGAMYANGVLLNRNGAEAWDAESGKLLWKKEVAVSTSAAISLNYRGEVSPGCLVDPSGRVFEIADQTIQCLDLKTGGEKWKTQIKGARDMEGLVACAGGLVFTMQNADGPFKWQQDKNVNRILRAYDAATGNFRWEYASTASYKRLVFPHGNGVITVNNKKIVELDPATGKEKRTILEGEVTPDKFICVPQYTAGSWILRGGREWNRMINLDTGAFFNDSTIRGACDYGIIPANGLLYQGLNACKCTNALHTIAAFANVELPDFSNLKPEGRLQKGPAYGKAGAAGDLNHDDCPVWRLDSGHRNSTESGLSGELKIAWQAKLPAAAVAPTVVDDKVVCAVPDCNEVCAMDAASGRELWHFTAGSRVDSSPTWHGGMLYFGSHDGCVYCLDAASGNLAWQFQAAPEDRRMVAFGHFESLWPVYGSLAVDDKGTVYAAAGRHSESSGGIFAWALDGATGQPKWRQKMGPFGYTADSKARVVTDEKTKQPGALVTMVPEIRDGNVYLCQGLNGPAPLNPATGQGAFGSQSKTGAITALLPLTDDTTVTNENSCQLSHFVRSLWLCNGRAARLWCSNDSNQWGIGRKGDGISHSNIKAIDVPASGPSQNLKSAGGKNPFFVDGMVDGKEWQQILPVNERPLAILRAGDRVCVASIVDENPATGILRIFNAATGEPMGDLALPAAPVFNGMSAARGRLFVALQNSSLVELFGKNR